MNDDWRLRVDLHEPGTATSLGQVLEAFELERDIESTFHDRVVVSVDGPEVFCYAATRGQAEAARAQIERIAAEHGWRVEYELRRWHPTAEEWEDPDEPLPATGAEEAAEHAQRVQDEREQSAEEGYPEFEVRVQCGTHRETIELVRKLEDEGLRTVHRWRYLLLGASDEDAANALAARIRAEVPPGCEVTVEGTLREVYDNRPPNPFAVFGGLAG